MPTIAAKLASLISERIISGQFAPGTKLDERTLAEQFKVSRTPVREALRQLATRGLTQILPMRGVVVTDISVKDLAAILQADCELEALCARLAAESMGPMEKSELEYLHERARAFVASGDLDGYLDANREFHALILRGAHNEVLEKMVGDIRDRLSPYRQYHPAETDRLGNSHAGHDAIVQAILAGQGEQAYLAMRSHNAQLGNAALRALRQARETPPGTPQARPARLPKVAAKAVKPVKPAAKSKPKPKRAG